MAIQRRLENVELAEEAAGERDADQREQEDCEQRGGERLLAAQALKIVRAAAMARKMGLADGSYVEAWRARGKRERPKSHGVTGIL